MELSGWHALIILGMLLVAVGIIAGGVALGLYFSRKSFVGVSPARASNAVSANAASPVSAADLRAARLAELSDLAERGLLSGEEYAAKRAEILAEI